MANISPTISIEKLNVKSLKVQFFLKKIIKLDKNKINLTIITTKTVFTSGRKYFKENNIITGKESLHFTRKKLNIFMYLIT